MLPPAVSHHFRYIFKAVVLLDTTERAETHCFSNYNLESNLNKEHNF